MARQPAAGSPTFATFETWAEVLAHVSADRPIWYQAPLDWRPVRVECHLLRGGQRVRVVPPSADVDPFTADAGHLQRFKYQTAGLQLAGRCIRCNTNYTASQPCTCGARASLRDSRRLAGRCIRYVAGTR